MLNIENKYKLYLFIIALCIFTGYILGFFIAKQYYGDLETRLQLMEQQYTGQLKPGQEIKMDEVKILITKAVDEVKNQYDLALKLGLPLTIAALLASIFGAYQWAAETAKQKAEEAFKDPDLLLKESCKILVLTQAQSDETWIRRFFIAFRFGQYDFAKIQNAVEHAPQSYDLVLLYAPEDGTGLTDEINKLANAGAKSVFYFGKGRAAQADLDKDGRLAFANAKAQLYGNLLNALKLSKSF